MQNGQVENFNRRLRHKGLIKHTLIRQFAPEAKIVPHARNAVGNWRRDYNAVRPHSALGMRRRKNWRERTALSSPSQS
jgi:transposase InsO family protein